MIGLLLGILTVVLHELSHVVAARAQGLKVKRFGVTWKGPYIVREAGSARQNLVVCLAGPVMNLILMAVFWHLSTRFGFYNFVLGAFNLLPIPGSDGHRAKQLLPELSRHTGAPVPSTAAAERL